MSVRNGHLSNICLWTFYFCILFITNNLAVGLANNWGITKINTNKISYLWTVTNYSLHDFKYGKGLISLIFPGDNSDKYQWELHLYPKGINDSDWIALYLHSKNEINVTAYCEFFIMDENGKKTNSHSYTHTFSHHSRDWGWHKFVLQSDLNNKTKNLLPNDSLTVLVEIIVKEGITNISGGCKFTNNVSNTEHMGMLLENSFLSDVQLRVDDQVLVAHRTILATHGSWFLHEFTKNPHLDALYIENTTVAAAKQALRFMYTGKAEIDEGNVEELLSLSDQLGMPQLKLITEEVLCKSMNPTNAIDILKLAELHHAKHLAREVGNYIAAHADRVTDSPAFKELEKTYHNPFYYIVRIL